MYHFYKDSKIIFQKLFTHLKGFEYFNSTGEIQKSSSYKTMERVI